jgi:sigma-B regulation protein RsbU (phosphoserine phosphatase)
MPRWRVAAGSLAPLVPGMLLLLVPIGEGPSILLLLAAVTFGCLVGGATAGVAALVLGGFLLDLGTLPPRLRLALNTADVPALLAFLLAGAGMIIVLSRLHATYQRAEQGRAAAERRAQELAERVELIGPLLDAAPIGFALLDTDLRYRYVNERLAEINGVAAADHLGRRVADMFPPELVEALEGPTREVLRTGQPQPHVNTELSLGGVIRHFLGSRQPLRDADGRIVGVVVAVLDVTEQATLQQQITRTVAELTATIASAPFAIALIDTDLCYQHVNNAYRELCATGEGDLRGRRLTDGDLPDGLLDGCRTALAEGRPVDAETTVAGGRRAALNCYPVRLDDGTVIGVAVMLVDTTERHRLAQLEVEAASLRATAELAFRLEEAQRLAGFGSWEYDVATGRFSFSKQISAILGITHRDYDALAAVGAQVHPDDVDRVRAVRDALMAHNTPFICEYRLICPDGRTIDVLSTGEAVLDESGRQIRLWGTIQDVTAQRAAERAAREARADLEVEHQALQMFQRAMLPAELPQLDTVDLVAVYLPMAERIDIGGDWYDGFLLPDGRLALAIGDVTGHDLRAATVMGQVRNAVRAYATEHPDPGEVLARVNTLLARLPDLDLVTMLFGVYDPGTHELVWSSAGHPSPLLRRGGEVTTLDQPGGLLLGVVPDGETYPEHRLRLDPGDSVLWYTDGIVDQRAIDPVVALERLSRSFARASDDLLGTVSADMLSDGDREDDVCLLALRRRKVRAEAHRAAVSRAVRADLEGVW